MSRPELWLATQNPKKSAELRRFLPAWCQVRSVVELDGAPRIVEDAPDFLGNARKKATAVSEFLAARGIRSDAVVVADDSGLRVDALGGRPGVGSARYAGEGASDADRIAKLLREMKDVPPPQRTARFVCALVAMYVSGLPFLSTEEVAAGMILEAPSGGAGFGYDPVFVPSEAPPDLRGESFAALSAEQKDALSHRGKAMRRLARRLVEVFEPGHS